MNAILRSLVSLPPFLQDLKDARLSNSSLASTTFYRSLCELIKEIETKQKIPSYKAINPYKIKEAMSRYSTMYAGYAQQVFFSLKTKVTC
jgi:hypothetical protein